MQFNRILKYLSFGCVCLIIPVLAVATIFEKLYGSQIVHDHIYTSIGVIIIWSVLSITGIWYIFRVNLYKKFATFSIHLSMVIILIGALTTHLSSKEGRLHLRVEEPSVKEYATTDGSKIIFPFEIRLKKFSLEYYPGTFSPSDFVSLIIISDKGKDQLETVSMNNVLKYKNFRFYQSGYDPDCEGTILTVATDPYGIMITYTGYVWLLVSLIMFFFEKKTIFRRLLSQLKFRNGIAILLITMGVGTIVGAPTTFPKDVAEEFGNLYIYYNGRIAPVNSFATDFTKKISGRERYEGLIPEQIVTGWLFYYDDWKKEPFIKIKGKEIQQALGLTNAYASLTDFVGRNGYKLTPLLEEGGQNSMDVLAANEKFNLISGLATGASLNIYPFREKETGNLKWFSVIDKPTEEMPYDQWLFIRNSMSLVAEKAIEKDWDGVKDLLKKIQKYQINEGTDLLPDIGKIKTEKLYNGWNFDKPFAIFFLTAGFILFFIFMRNLVIGSPMPSIIITINLVLLAALSIYLIIRIGLRWYVSGHVPLSNGFETMQFMALCCSIATLFLSMYYKLIIPFGFIIIGFTLLVAMMGESSPQITNLMPVLQSPLLSVHVMVIMLSYSLLSLITLNGLAAIILNTTGKVRGKINYLQELSRVMLYPAVFLLAIGIFVGAVWANVSWGRYWGWDPKEVWALITFLIYSLPLHTSSLPLFKRPIFFHTYIVFAFLSVLITYFGVNFFLGGMHSYA